MPHEITGETKLLALAGYPTSHSLSPQIHNCFSGMLGLQYAYLAFDVKPDKLKSFIDAVLTLGISGFNLTMPLKLDVLTYLDELDRGAELYGAVNTVVNRNGRLVGYNTDGAGFIMSLERAGFGTESGKALILGVGGAAKAVSIALAEKGMEVKLATRRNKGLLSVYKGTSYCAWDEIWQELDDCSLLVNATPLGMHGNNEDFSDLSFLKSVKPDTVVCDLIYAPRETTFLNAAKLQGLKTMNGLPLLLYQAALSFKLFTGVIPSDEAISAALTSIMQ